MISALAMGGQTELPHIRTWALFDGAITCGLDRVYVPHAFAQVRGVGVVCRVHSQRFGIVIDGDVDWAAESLLQAGAGTTAAGEVVDDQLIAQVKGHGEGVALHAASPSGAIAAFDWSYFSIPQARA